MRQFFLIAMIFTSMNIAYANPFINIYQLMYLNNEKISGMSYFTTTDGYDPSLNQLKVVTEGGNETTLKVDIIYSNIMQQPPNYKVLETKFEITIPDDFPELDTIYQIYGHYSKMGNVYEAYSNKFFIHKNNIGASEPVLPADNSINVVLTPYFKWTPDKYLGDNPYVKFQLSTTSDFSAGSMVFDSIITGTKFPATFVLKENTEYFWRIARMLGSNRREWSDVFSFTTSENSSWQYLTDFQRKINGFAVARNTGYLGLATDTSAYFSFDFCESFSKRQSNYKPPVSLIVSDNDKKFYYLQKHTAYSFNELIKFDTDENTFRESFNIEKPTAMDLDGKGRFLFGASNGFVRFQENQMYWIDDNYEYTDTNIFISAVKLRLEQFGKVYAAIAFKDSPGTGALYMSSDSAVTWEKVPGLPNFFISDMDVTNEGALIVSGWGENGSIYYTTNSGEVWLEIASGLPAGGVKHLEIDSRGNFYAIPKNENGIYFSEDYGESWIPFNEGLDDVELDFIGSTQDTLLLAANSTGNIYMRKTGNSAGIVKFPRDEETNVPVNVTLSWPNNPRAEKYHLQYYSTPFGIVKPGNELQNEDIVFEKDDSTLTENRFSASGLSMNSVYHWRLRQQTKFGWGEWSEYQTFTTESAGSVDTFDSKTAMIISPNPANDYISVSNYTGEIKIINSLGINMFNGNIDANQLIDITKFASGVYFVCAGNSAKAFIVLR